MNTDLQEIALTYTLLPQDSANGEYLFSTADPKNTSLREQLEFVLGAPVQFEYMPLNEVVEAIQSRYGELPGKSKLAELIPDGIDEYGGISEQIFALINGALEYRASDIHLESREDGLEIRLRIDGILERGPTIHKDKQSAFLSHLKVLANLDVAEKRRPQDGKIRFQTQQQNMIDIRVSTIPTVYGEKMVLRLLNRQDIKLQLNELGMTPEQQTQFEEVLHAHQGIIVVTGPTGSGKTTTLYSALNYINSPQINILTVEDPIEYELEGLNQTQVHPSIGYTFAQALRAFLRQDPDVIFVGEIRDTETARIAIRASLTGHLVFSTLHTNNALDTITRLLDMSIEPYLLASSLKMVIAQRLVRKICQECNGEPLKQKLCQNCFGTGFVGRIGVFELLPITENVKSAIHQQVNNSKLKQIAGKEEILTLSEAGSRLVENQVTTDQELYRVLS